MENQVSTIVCPNCGASTSGLFNCEYCGSFLVQKTRQGVDMTQYCKIASQYQNIGLQNAIKSFMDEIRSNPDTKEIFWIDQASTGRNIQVTNSRTDDVMHPLGCEGACIAFSFFDESTNTAQCFLSRFKQSNVYNAFTAYSCYKDDDRAIEQLDIDEIQYYANFGYDAEGASQVILQIMIDVYGANPNEIRYGEPAKTLTPEAYAKLREENGVSEIQSEEEPAKKKLSTSQIIYLVLSIIAAIIYFILSL